MKFNSLIIFAITTFLIALVSFLNSAGILLSFVSSDLVSYLASIVNSLIFVLALLIFYFVGERVNYHRPIVLTMLVLYGGAVIGYFVAYLVFFQFNPLIPAYYGSIVYLQALFDSFTTSVPLALAAFSGLGIAHLRKSFQQAGAAAAPMEGGDVAKKPGEGHDRVPTTEVEETGHQVEPQSEESKDDGEF